MASVLKEVHEITKELHDHLILEFPKDEGREEYIEKIEKLLGMRESLMQQLDRPNGEEEVMLAQEILEMNKIVNVRMNAAFGVIRMDINSLKKRKQTGLKYENPYDGPTADGVFFDSKK
ncbi:flagellar protein [Evansella sp. AB-P1]|uniref:flagellar protein n=1 Tax=Evansella sp. AB-P1 TaxID=3037653 RepID=UPI00241CBE01|nr:flagellar protein [Evansella sp. AB-P1]MDG5786661.1 flagellar protein [Evansella sp. AB-P1]